MLGVGHHEEVVFMYGLSLFVKRWCGRGVVVVEIQYAGRIRIHWAGSLPLRFSLLYLILHCLLSRDI